MWKVHDFSVTQILREVNFGKFKSCKSAVCTTLGALKMVNLVDFRLQRVPKFIKKYHISEPLNSECVEVADFVLV